MRLLTRMGMEKLAFPNSGEFTFYTLTSMIELNLLVRGLRQFNRQNVCKLALDSFTVPVGRKLVKKVISTKKLEPF